MIAIAALPIATASTASPIQMASQAVAFAARVANPDAANAVTPIATWPQPGKAVTAEARSIVWRMNRRSSTACSLRGTVRRCLRRMLGNAVMA